MIAPSPSDTTCDWADGRGLPEEAGVHLIGIGGCGMRAAAGILLGCGLRVSGSDQNDFAGMGNLVATGPWCIWGTGPLNCPTTSICW